MLCVTISDIAIIIVKGANYRCIVHDISKSKAINLLVNYRLDNRGTKSSSAAGRTRRWLGNTSTCPDVHFNI